VKNIVPSAFLSSIPQRLSRRFGLLSELIRSRDGNFSILFILSFVPLAIAVGTGIDFSRALNARTEMQADLDAAILSATKDIGKDTEANLKTKAEKTMKAMALQRGSYTLNELNITVNATSKSISATASTIVPTTLMRLAGIDEVPVKVASAAAGGKDTYYELHLVLDKSASMLLAATTYDQSIMQKLSLNCVFACHDTAYGEKYQGVYYSSYYDYARAKKVVLRADVQADAVATLMDTIDASDPSHNRIKVAVYTLGTNSNAAQVLKSNYKVSNGIRQVIAPTYSTKDIRTQMVSNTELTSASSYITTDFRALTTLNNYISKAGDGTSASSPLKIVVMITDGAQSSADWVFSGQPYITPLNNAWCDTMKKQGATFSVLYTTYLPWTNRSEYNNTIGNTMSSSNYKSMWGGTMPSSKVTRHDYLTTALTACASSPDYFISAASPDEIKAGLTELVGKTLGSLRLTQ
jgi:Flp pilus assembly protein TadG